VNFFHLEKRKKEKKEGIETFINDFWGKKNAQIRHILKNKKLKLPYLNYRFFAS
jgi:hypothetical protein